MRQASFDNDKSGESQKRSSFQEPEAKRMSTGKIILIVLGVLFAFYLVSSMNGGSSRSSRSSQIDQKSSNSTESKRSTAVTVKDVGGKVVETNSVWWKYSWKVTLANQGENNKSVNLLIQFMDADGFAVDQDLKYGIPVPAGAEKVVSDFTLVDVQAAPNVKSVHATIQ